MTEAHLSSLAPFTWVSKRDGRLVPFEADKISRALFAASERLGQPNAFLARELTDSILHFLAAEAAQAIPTTAEIAELVVKVVRELGQPALAQAFADFAQQGQRRRERAETPPPAVVGACARPSVAELAAWVEGDLSPADLRWRAGEALLREYAVSHVFTRDLIAAQGDGLLTLTGLETPLELAGGVLPLTAGGHKSGVLEAVAEARHWAGGFVAIDGPEWSLTDGASAESVAIDFARELNLALRLTHLCGVVNLNSQAPPSWADHLAEGPLFASNRRGQPPERLTALAGAMLEQLLQSPVPDGGLRVDWHLGGRDFLPDAAATLLWLTRLALSGAELAFVFDRPRRPVSLAEGTDRQHPAVLLAVGLQLTRLAEFSGLRSDPARFLQKLGSLVRLAISAALQKREFLRRHSHRRPGMTQGFRLERARLLVMPVGLEESAQHLVGEGSGPEGTGLAFARRVLQQLQACLRQDGPVCQLECCLDNYPLPPPGQEPQERATGVWAWSPGESRVSLKNQLWVTSPLQAGGEMGTVGVLVSDEHPPTAEEAAQLLGVAWQQTEVARVRFLRVARPHRQLTAPWIHETTPVREAGQPEGRLLLP